jgi:hypothetical protein
MIHSDEVFNYWKRKIEEANYEIFHYLPYTNRDRIECIERYEEEYKKEVETIDKSDIDKDHEDFIKFSFEALERLKDKWR